jgi:hypothetical protein
MAKDSFITELRGDIENNNLPIFNEFTLLVGNPDLAASRSACYKVSAVTAENKQARAYVVEPNKYFTRVDNPQSPYYVHLTEFLWPDSSTSTNVSQDFYTLLGNLDFRIENKYNLKSLFVGGRIAFDVKQLSYCDLSDKIQAEYAIGNLDEIVQFPNSKEINFDNPALSLSIKNDIEGSIAAFSNCTACEKLLIRNNQKLTGNIELLGKLTNLKELRVDSDFGISGTIERFVAAQIDNGRTAVSQENAIKIYSATAGALRFGGNVYNPKVDEYLTWESANKIIIYAGNSATDYTKVLAKGATAEEIAAWEAAGKTVTVVN